MRIVVDAIPVRPGSAAIVIEHLLAGWQQLDVSDEVHVVITADSELALPEWVTMHRLAPARGSMGNRLRAQSFELPRVCRSVAADVLLGAVPATTTRRLRCPRVVIAYDLRHELRPAQFSRQVRLLRKVSYGIAFRQADGIICISERTRADLLRSRPWLSDRPVVAAPLGADHVDAWATTPAASPYAISFGHFGNKNVGLLLEGWALLRQAGESLPLLICGVPASARDGLQAQIEHRGLSGQVTLLPWLSTEEFEQRFAAAAVVVFPSDFEGYGLPAVEAMRRGIPLVITPEPALLEATGGHAAVMQGWGADALAQAVREAQAMPKSAIASAAQHVADLTWASTAQRARDVLTAAIRRRTTDRTGA